MCGTLAGAGLACCWSHDQAHRFFSRFRWSRDEPGRAVAVALLVPAGKPVAARSTTPCSGGAARRWAAGWFHDGSAPGPAKTGYGNNRVIAAVVVRLPEVTRSVAIPLLAELAIEDTSSASRPCWRAAWRRCWPKRCPAGPSMWSPTPPMPAGS